MKALIIPISMLLLFAVAIYKRRTIKALIFKIIYGDYHINYLGLFYEEDNYYSNYYPSKSSLFQLITKMNSAIGLNERTKSYLPLHFQNIEYGISSNKLVHLIGKPITYDVISLEDEKLVSLVYNLGPNNVVDKYIYHFKNDRYLMGEFHFNKVESELQNNIIDNINSKYKTKYSGKDDFVIESQNGNIMYYTDKGFKIIVSYFNPNCEEVQYLINYLDAFKKKKRSEYVYSPNVGQLSF